MDDVEDDARYPPNPYPQNPHNRHHSAHSQRPNPQFSRNFTDQDEDDDEDQSNSDGIDQHHPHNANNSSAHHEPADYMEEGEDEAAAVDDDDDDSSMESRGKRRKLDNFEFVPRKPVPVPATASSKPAVKNSPPDWSEDSTFILLDAWGDLFVKNGRKSLRSDEWSEVGKKVNQASRINRSDSQCRNRLDTLKKKYKKEKARMAEFVSFKSDWVYFKKMDSLMTSPSPVEAAAVPKSSPLRLACGVDAGEYVFSNSRVYLNRANAMDEMRDSPGDTPTDDDEGDEDDDESDGLPPVVSDKSKKVRGRSSGSIPSSSFRMLADSIQKFGEVYEKIESSKRQQMAELDRMRKEFHRDLELQKRQILERAQAEIARIRQEEGEDEEEEERVTGDGDGNDDEIDGSAENLSG